MIKFLIILFLSLPITTLDDVVDRAGLYNEILEQGLEFPDIVFAQAILESSHFNSQVFKENNNLFGMRVPKKRKTTSIGSKNGFAVYDSWRESIVDYYYFQEFVFSKKKMSKQDYIEYLEKNYAKDSNYSYKIKVIILRYKEILYQFDGYKKRENGTLSDNF